MSDIGKQQLGIELNLTINGKFESLIKQIEERLSKLNLAGAVKQIEAIEKAVAKSHKAADGLDFSKLNNAQWKLIEGNDKYGVSITKVKQNLSDLNKVTAETINHQRKWEAGYSEVNGKMIPTTKALADAIVESQKQSTRAHNTRIKELTEEQKKQEEIRKAYAAKRKQDGTDPSAIAKQADAAYAAREKEISLEDRLTSTKQRLLDKRIKAQEDYVNRMSDLRVREVAIEKRKESDYYKSEGARYMRSYTDDGNYPVNGGWVKRTAASLAKRSTMGEIQASAIDMNTVYSGMSKAEKAAADKFWNAAVEHNREGGKRLKQEFKEIAADATEAGKAAFQDQQKNWNRQAGTSGVKYKQNPYGEGFVRESVDTSYVDRLRQANAVHAEYAKSAEKSKTATSLFGESIGQAIKHLVEFYTIRKVLFAVSGEFTEAVSSILKFNQAIADTAAITNASEEGVKKFALAAYNISQSTKMNLDETMKMVNLLAQSGVSEKDVPLVSKVTAMFATGTGSSAENAVRVMTTSMNVWNIEAERSAVIADTLAAGLNSAKLEVNELSTVFNYLAPIAHQAGYSIQETTGIIATMSQMGVKASTIGTGMAQVLTRLMAPTAGVKSLFKAYNIELEDVNPRLHKFSDIIKTIQQADGGRGIPIQDLLKGFGNIAGRAMAAAKSAGSEYFEEMERNVSLGNASLVAYSKSIQGVGYQLNVLKQTFTEFIGSWTSVNDAASVGYTLLMDFVRGLLTTEGKIVLVSTALAGLATALYAARAALWSFATSNPLTLAATAISVVVGGVITALGTQSEAVQKAHRDHDQLAKSMGDVQRAFQAISDIYGKAAASGKLNNEISVEHRKEINKLVNTYPALHGLIDTTTKKYSGLTKTMHALNGEMDKMSDKNAANYNSNVDMLENLKNKRAWGGLRNSYNDNIKSVDRATAYSIKEYDEFHKGASAAERNQYIANLNKKADEQKLEITLAFRNDPNVRQLLEDLSVQLAGAPNYQPGDYDKHDPYKLLFSKLVKRPPIKSSGPTDNTSVNPDIETRNGGNHMKPIDVEASLTKYANIATKEQEALITKQMENNIKIAIENLKSVDDETQYKVQADKIKESYEVYKQRLVEQFITDQWTLIGQNLLGGAEYDRASHTFKFPDSEQGRLNRAEYNKVRTKHPDLYVANVTRAVNAKTAEAESNGDLKAMKVPAFTPSAASAPYSSRDAEKRADRELEATTKALALKRDLARTAEEVRQIDLEQLAAGEKNSVEKIRVFTLEKEALEKLKEPTENQKERLASINDQIRSTNALLDEQRRKYNDLANTGFWYNFSKGVSASNKELGTYSSNTEQLGKEVTATLENGMVGVIDETIQKLSKLEWSWRSFASALGDIMNTISKELTRYIAKMLVVYAVQKLIGLFASSSGQTAYQANSPALSQGAAMNFGDELVSQGFLPKADGGLVPLNMGTPGKDSIRALLTPGEFVVKASSVQKYGVENLKSINDQRFASGGFVGNSKSSNDTNDKASGNLTIINVADPSSIPPAKPNEAQIINIVSFAMEKNASFKQQIKNIAQR